MSAILVPETRCSVGRRSTGWRATGACLVLASLAAVSPAGAYGREAVKNALAATVAIEWRSDEKDEGESASAPAARGMRRTKAVPGLPAAGGGPVGFAFAGGAGGLPPARELSLASGVLVSADGLVVTHSPEAGSGKYTVYLADGRSLPARVLVDDQRNGLRLLKVDAEGLPSVALAEAEAEVGDPVIAGFCTDRRGRAAAQGMVAAEYRVAIGGPVLLDLSAGRMSTGGPVVDGAGRLVGVLSGKHDRGVPAGSSAVPLDAVRGLVQARQGENIVVVPRGYLGIQLETKVDGGREHIVARILPDSPAGAGGMVDGDEIVAVDGEHVASPGEVAGAVARHTAGEKMRLAVLREGTEQKLEVVVGLPASAGASAAPARVPSAAREVNVIRPEQLYVMTEDGKWRAIAVTGTQLEPLLAHVRQLHPAPVAGPGAAGGDASPAEPAPHVIRVERSDLTRKLEAIGLNVLSLEQQLQKLTEEIKSLRAKLAE
ncbi:MAG TPA: trypsin-like peptidase domain-containing protein [Pirellulales bacterium]|nr:trypsin-like peptidase domain-containing protein [Pirellulales bacterium]